jgi:hypothetical protein
VERHGRTKEIHVYKGQKMVKRKSKKINKCVNGCCGVRPQLMREKEQKKCLYYKKGEVGLCYWETWNGGCTNEEAGGLALQIKTIYCGDCS